VRELLGKRIFLASPNDMAEERDGVRQTIEKFNESFAWDYGTNFFHRGWEQTSSGVGRPQQQIIDRTLSDCDYLVLILGSRWGSAPQIGEGYESGTEEEFERTIELLADSAAPMRNVFVGFKGVLPSQERNEQLERVLEFKDQLERSKTIMFKVFDSTTRLSELLTANLFEWSDDKSPKSAKQIVLLPRESLTVQTQPQSPAEITDLANDMIRTGRLTQAEEFFNMAVATGDARAMLEYARFLRRGGRLESALSLNRAVLQRVAQSREPTDVSLRTRALANIGIIQRKQGNAEDSARTLNEAIEEYRGAENDSELEAYIRDNLAHTFGQLGDQARVIEELRLSREIRQASGTPVSAAALVNEARAQVRLKNREAALQLIDLALQSEVDDAVRANALDVKRRALYEIQDYEGAVEAATACLQLNQQLGNSDGASVAEFGLALALVAAERFDDAAACARAALERNLRSGNATGRASALWALAQAARGAGDAAESAHLVEDALAAARAAQNAPMAAAIAKWNEGYSSDQADDD
jgi:tetratricopeptide (TPR) repeat protein